MSMAAVGILASIIGTFFVRTKENASQKTFWDLCGLEPGFPPL